MLTFQEYPAQFAKPTYGEEMHGDEAKPLVSIYVEAVVNADVLEAIKPGLRDALFVRPALNDSARIGENGAVNDLVRRFTTMEPVRLEDEYPGYSLTVHGDLIDAETKWADVELGKLSIEPQDGGTAKLKVRCQMRGDGLEWWVGMMNRSGSITLEPPKAEPLPAEHPDNPDAGDAFAGSDLASDPPAGLRTIDASATMGEGTSITGPAGPLMDAIEKRANKATGKRSKTAATAH